jgi:hypothetical protein
VWIEEAGTFTRASSMTANPTLPILGVALPLAGARQHRDWILEKQRDLELQDFFWADVLRLDRYCDVTRMFASRASCVQRENSACISSRRRSGGPGGAASTFMARSRSTKRGSRSKALACSFQ